MPFKEVWGTNHEVWLFFSHHETDNEQEAFINKLRNPNRTDLTKIVYYVTPFSNSQTPDSTIQTEGTVWFKTKTERDLVQTITETQDVHAMAYPELWERRIRREESKVQEYTWEKNLPDLPTLSKMTLEFEDEEVCTSCGG